MDGVADVLLIARVDITPPSATLGLQETLQLEAIPKTEGGVILPARNITWSSSAPTVISVSPTGLVRALEVGGPVTIRATIEGVDGVSSITVTPVPVDHITVTPGQPSIMVGASSQLTAKAFDAAGGELPGRSFTWVSNAPTIAPVTTDGLVFGQAAGGPVTITATTGGKAGTAQVTVSARPATRLGFAQQPGPAIAGQNMVPAIRVAVQNDLLGTVTTATNPVTIALAGNPGGATLTGTRTVAAVNGIAIFNDLKLDRAAQGYTLLASATGLVSVTSLPFDVTAGSANQLSFSVALPGTARSGVAFSPQPVIQLRDGGGNAVALPGILVTASIASGPGSIGGTATALTNASGTATFANLFLSGPVGTYRVAFSAVGMLPVTSGSIALTAGFPTALTMTTQPPGSAPSGAVLSPQPAVQLRDQAGNAVAQSGVGITASISLSPDGGQLGGNTVVTTNASGQASFSNLSLTGPGGSYVLAFDGSGITGVTSNVISLGAGAGTVLSITTQPSATAVSGTAFTRQPVIQLRDGANNPVSQAGVLVTATIQTGGGALGGTTTVATNGSGVATFTNLAITGTAGNRTLLFAASGYVSAVSGTIALTAGSASLLSITVQPSSSAQSGAAFAQQPVLLVTDAAGNPVGGVTVTAAMASGGGTLGGTTTASSNASGVAGFTDLAITGTVGSYTLSFGIPGGASVTSAAITLTVAGPSQLTIGTPPSSTVQSGVPFPQQPVLLVRDASNNGIAGVVVTAAIASGGGTLGGTVTATTGSGGGASFTDLSITGSVGSRTLSFSAPGLSSVTSGSINVTGGSASQLSITTQPSSTVQTGVVFAQQPVLQVTDASNNPVAGAAVTAAIASGGGTLGGTLTVTSDAAGNATFTDLSISGTTGPRTLSFTTTGAPAAISNSVTVTGGAPTQLAILVQPPATAQSGVVFTQHPVVQVSDAGNNPVAGVTVDVKLASGGGTLAGTVSVATNSSGVATFSTLSIGGLVGVRTLEFSATGLSPATSTNIDLLAGPAAKLGIVTQPSAIAVQDLPFGQQPVIQLLDAAGNPVSRSGVTVNAAINSGPGALKGTKGITTNSSGVANYTNLFIDKPGTNTLKFTSSGLTQVVSNPIVVF